ncbi:MAG: hypothetical protein LUH45_01705 [Clostridiales bacterium]|nr:hypothetical protein [Clostridiales bacterium]
MTASSAVIFVLREAAQSSCDPFLLQKILFSPAASWLAMGLERQGVERFFVVAEDDLTDLTAGCFPAGTEVVSCADPSLNQRLMDFAAECEGKVITITEPVWLSCSACQELVEEEFLTPAGDVMGVYRVEAADLAEGGVDALNYGDYYSPLNDPEIQLLPLTSTKELFQARELGLADNLYRLMAEGVDLIDPSTTYVEAGAQVVPGSVIMPNTILMGRVKTGEGCVLGPNSMLTDCELGSDCVVNASQVSGVRLPDGTRVGPFQVIKE